MFPLNSMGRWVRSGISPHRRTETRLPRSLRGNSARDRVAPAEPRVLPRALPRLWPRLKQRIDERGHRRPAKEQKDAEADQDDDDRDHPEFFILLQHQENLGHKGFLVTLAGFFKLALGVFVHGAFLHSAVGVRSELAIVPLGVLDGRDILPIGGRVLVHGATKGGRTRQAAAQQTYGSKD